jgi:hypothetical protein
MNSPLSRGPTAVRCILLVSAAFTGRDRPYPRPNPATRLEPVVVIATRTPADVRTLGTRPTRSRPRISRASRSTPRRGAGRRPGHAAVRQRRPGSDISVFTRGANSDQTLFLVDGIRLNDANTDYAVFLGGARLGATDTIEIARGPQSTLYGSEAVGGVISIQAQKGTGAPSADLLDRGGKLRHGRPATSPARAPRTSGPGPSPARAPTPRTRPEQRLHERRPGAPPRPRPELLGVRRRHAPRLRGALRRPGRHLHRMISYAHETESNWLGTVFADFKPVAGLDRPRDGRRPGPALRLL